MNYEKALEQLGLNPDIRLRQMFELGRLAAQTSPVAIEVSLVEWVGNKLMATPKVTAPASWTEMVTANLVREGVNKHKARELAEHFHSPAAQLATAFAGYHITTDKVEIFLSEKQAIDWRDQYQPGFARVEKLVSGGVVN